MNPVANYTSQRSHLVTLASKTADLKAVFLAGPADYGKTYLLRWFEEMFGMHVRIVRLDFGDPSQTFTPRLAMTVCAAELGYEHFEEFKREDASLHTKHEARIQDVTVTGSYNTITATAGATEEDQLSIAIGLIKSFATGLKRAVQSNGSVVLCFDGYRYDSGAQRAGGNGRAHAGMLHRWLDLGFVKSMCEIDNVRLVIAGRDIPEDGIPRRAVKRQCVVLSGVAEADEWIKLAAKLGKLLPGESPEAAREQLKGILNFTGGAPGGIMRWLQGLPSAGA